MSVVWYVWPGCITCGVPPFSKIIMVNVIGPLQREIVPLLVLNGTSQFVAIGNAAQHSIASSNIMLVLFSRLQKLLPRVGSNAI